MSIHIQWQQCHGYVTQTDRERERKNERERENERDRGGMREREMYCVRICGCKREIERGRDRSRRDMNCGRIYRCTVYWYMQERWKKKVTKR